MNKIETSGFRLSIAGGVRVKKADDKTGLPKEITARVLTYDVVDDYGTVWIEGVFDESMGQRMPRIVWSHDWSEPIGRWTDWRNVTDEDTGQRQLELDGVLDDFDAVPQAKRAAAQLASGTLDQFSVGFRNAAHRVSEDGRFPKGTVEFIKATLDEASVVLAGAVPGTKTVSLRSAPTATLRQVIRLDALLPLLVQHLPVETWETVLPQIGSLAYDPGDGAGSGNSDTADTTADTTAVADDDEVHDASEPTTDDTSDDEVVDEALAFDMDEALTLVAWGPA